MRVQRIEILGEVDDIFDTNVDVSVTLENGYSYLVVVVTLKNLMSLMEYEKAIFYLQATP